MERTFPVEKTEFFDKKALVFFLVLTAEGKIVEANRYARYLTDRALIGEHLRDIVVDFSGRLDLATVMEGSSNEQLINIATASGLPQSFYFSFLPTEGGILAFGRLDADELERMRKEIVSQNNELSTLARELHRKNAQLKRLNTKLEKSLQEIKQLSGLLPICSSCKKIRDDRGYWNQLEAYIEERSEAMFSHSICKDCAKTLYPDLDLFGDETEDR